MYKQTKNTQMKTEKLLWAWYSKSQPPSPEFHRSSEAGTCAQLLSCVWLSETPWTAACPRTGSSVRGIFQARVLEWVAIFPSRGSSHPKDWAHISSVSCTTGRFFPTEPWESPQRQAEWCKSCILKQGEPKACSPWRLLASKKSSRITKNRASYVIA